MKQYFVEQGLQLNTLVRGLSTLAGIGIGLASYAILREPANIQLEHLALEIPNAEGRLPRDGLRILHLSDTHFQGLEWRERIKIERIRQLTRGLQYDLLVHTGDFWHNEAGLNNLLALLDVLPPAKLGAFGVMGNHDYACYSHADALSRNWNKFQSQQTLEPHSASVFASPVRANGGAPPSVRSSNGTSPVQPVPIKLHEYPLHIFRFLHYVLNVPFELEHADYNDTNRLIRHLRERGITMLDNQSVHLCQEIEPGRHVDFYLAGVDDVSEGKPNLEGAFADVPPKAPTVLLSHNPDILEETEALRSDVVLSGHTHGGQIVLPVLGAAHTHSVHLGRKEASGYMRRGKTHVYVSRGVGEGIPLRFRAGPQITLVTITGG